MLRGLLVAGLAMVAMPAQAVTYIKYEAWGSAFEMDPNGMGVSGTFGKGSMTFYNEFQGPGVPALMWSSGVNWISFEDEYTRAFATFTFAPVQPGDPFTAENFVGGSGGAGWTLYSFHSIRITRVEIDPALTLGNGVSTTFSPSIPEPATWAMMIVGFAAIGGSLRGSRRKLAFA